MVISKNIVDVNEKIYSNSEGGEDETTIKIVNCVENTEGHNYTTTVTKGVQWGVNANVGLQLGLPQVGAGLNAGLGGNYQRSTTNTFSKEEKKENRVELQSHHEEKVKIPPGKKVTVKMTSYRVRYKLQYTMEYKIFKEAYIRVRIDTCGGLGISGILPLCSGTRIVTAEQLMQSLPGFREDEEFAYVTQEGELRWIADRMVVEKILTDM